MSRLLNAEFHRLIKYKPYWIDCIAVVLYGIYATLLNDFGYTPSIDSFLFEALPYICIITGVVFSQFIGEDYTCGTIRNKLINGHRRKTYYLTEIIVIFLANVTVFNLYVITTILAGLLRKWEFEFKTKVLFNCYIACIFTIFLITAMSVFLIILIRYKVAGLIAIVSLSIFLLIMGNASYNKLRQPEYRLPNEYEIEEKGITEPIQNALYYGGNIRKIYEFIIFSDPYGQAVYDTELMYDKYIEFDQSKVATYPYIKIIIFSILESTASIVIGIYLFNRKDIR